jgi:hypothetical protein
MGFVRTFCNLESYPELSRGETISGEDPSTDITGISTSSLYLSVNGSGPQEITIDLSSCSTASAIATELQRAINANSTYGFDEVTVEYDDDLDRYKIYSGRYGETSRIAITFNETSPHLCRALKLSPLYGATETPGNVDDLTLQNATVELVEMKYRKLGLEGMASGSIPGGVSFSASELPEPLLNTLLSKRRYR